MYGSSTSFFNISTKIDIISGPEMPLLFTILKVTNILRGGLRKKNGKMNDI